MGTYVGNAGRAFQDNTELEAKVPGKSFDFYLFFWN